MKKSITKIILPISISIFISVNLSAKSDMQTDTDIATGSPNDPIEIRSVRSILSAYDPVEHIKGQLRAGYIDFKEKAAAHASAYALAGHFHLYSKRWNGVMAGGEAYTVLNPKIDQSAHTLNGDFFDDEGKSFILLSQAYLDGKWRNTQIKLGRQSLDSPHADSDDIRMMPNYFEAYTLTNTDIDHFILTAGLIDKMAGWENGVNSAQFVDVGETLGTGQKIDGMYYTAATYEGVKDLSLSLWYYHYSDIANVLYAELGYTQQLSTHTTLTLGLQYDSSSESGAALLGEQDSQTYGISLEANFEDIGITVLTAYNKDVGDTGAMGLSLGGGPFFTSMEDHTIDALGAAGSAWVIGAGYNFKHLSLEGLICGIAYGDFEAEDHSIYQVNEINALLEYQWNEKISATAAYALVEHQAGLDTDYEQLRIIANYNF